MFGRKSGLRESTQPRNSASQLSHGSFAPLCPSHYDSSTSHTACFRQARCSTTCRRGRKSYEPVFDANSFNRHETFTSKDALTASLFSRYVDARAASVLCSCSMTMLTPLPFVGKQMQGSQDRVAECTTSNFDGMISMLRPEESWVAKWQRIGE